MEIKNKKKNQTTAKAQIQFSYINISRATATYCISSHREAGLLEYLAFGEQ